MTEPTHLQFVQDKPPGPQEIDLGPQLVTTARTIAAICATRMLLLIAVVTGCIVWGFTVYDPQRERLIAAVAFSLVFVLPHVVLYWRRG